MKVDRTNYPDCSREEIKTVMDYFKQSDHASTI
jgi:hypothetical protein